MKIEFKDVACPPETAAPEAGAEPVITLSADNSAWRAVVNMIQEVLERESPEPIVVASRSEQDLTEAVKFLNEKLAGVANDSDLTLELPMSIYQSVMGGVTGCKDEYIDNGVEIRVPSETVHSICSSLRTIAREHVTPVILPYNERFVYAVE